MQCEIPKCNPSDVALFYYSLEDMERFSHDEDMHKEDTDTLELFILDTCEAIDTALRSYHIAIFALRPVYHIISVINQVIFIIFKRCRRKVCW